VLARLAGAGIENLLALRGDPPAGEAGFRAAPGGFSYASELVSFIRESRHDFCVGAACYPEGHLETHDIEADLRHLVTKVAAGVDFLVTQLFFQLFFDNRTTRRSCAGPGPRAFRCRSCLG